MQIEEEVGQQTVVVNVALVVCAQPWQRAAVAGAIHGEALNALAQVHAAAKICGLRRLVVTTHIVRLLLQQRMHDGAMQALRIILDDELPVCFEMVNAPLDHLQFLHPPRLEFAVEPGQVLLEGQGTRGEVDEDVAVPYGGGDCVQWIVGFAKALNFFHVRRIGQRAVEFVSPGVILALDTPGELAFLLLAQHSSAMTANVVEGANASLLVACDDDTRVSKLAEKIISRFANLAGSSGAEPHVKVDGFHLALEPGRIGVITLRQSSGFRSRELRTRIGISHGHQLNIAINAGIAKITEIKNLKPFETQRKIGGFEESKPYAMGFVFTIPAIPRASGNLFPLLPPFLCVSKVFGYRRKSFTISRAALAPEPPVKPAPGCVPDPHK